MSDIVTVNITQEVQNVQVNVYEGGDAISSETDPIYTSEKPGLASKVDLQNHIEDTAEAHLARAIKVDQDPVANYTTVALNDTLQDVTNKVAGLQDNVVVKQVLLNRATSVLIEGNFGKAVSVNIYNIVLEDVSFNPTSGRLGIRINGVNSYMWGGSGPSSLYILLTSNAANCTGRCEVRIINNNIVLSSNFRTSAFSGYSTTTTTENITSIEIVNFTSIYMAAGTIIQVEKI